MINKSKKYLLILLVFTSYLLSNDLNQLLKNDNDFSKNLYSKKYNSSNSRTIFSIWEKSQNKKSFHHLNRISSIKYQDIIYDCNDCKKNNTVIINGNRYKYSKIIHTNKISKNIKNNELVDVYILFDLICSIQTKNEISILFENLNSQKTTQTETIVIQKNLIPQEWTIPIVDPVKKWEFNDYVKVVSPNRLMIWGKDNKISKAPVPLILTLSTLAAIGQRQVWSDHYVAMANANQRNSQEYDLAEKEMDKFTTITIGLSIPTIISIYDWVVNY